MEKDLNIILQNFLTPDQELIESGYKEQLKPIRIEYLQEIGRPGCTPCIMNAAKRKFSERVKSLFESKTEVEAELMYCLNRTVLTVLRSM